MPQSKLFSVDELSGRTYWILFLSVWMHTALQMHWLKKWHETKFKVLVANARFFLFFFFWVVARGGGGGVCWASPVHSFFSWFFILELSILPQFWKIGSRRSWNYWSPLFIYAFHHPFYSCSLFLRTEFMVAMLIAAKIRFIISALIFSLSN